MTPVIDGLDGAGFDHVDGRPAALFEYAPGTVGESLGDTGSRDLAGGITAAGLLARMHLISRHQTFAGSRAKRGDPLARLTRWVSRDGSDPEFLTLPGAADFLTRLSRLIADIRSALNRSSDLWVGLVHGDVAPNNLVLDPSGEVTALLDFDDCTYSYVLYDLCSILWSWGRSSNGQIDPHRARLLVAAYAKVRPLLDDEHRLLPHMFAAYMAADGVGKISWWWRGEGRPRPVSESTSYGGSSSWSAAQISAAACLEPARRRHRRPADRHDGPHTPPTSARWTSSTPARTWASSDHQPPASTPCGKDACRRRFRRQGSL